MKKATPGYRFLHASLRSKSARAALRSPMTRLAEMLDVSTSYVEKWLRPAPTADRPGASGYRNPVDFTDAIFDFWLLYCPVFAELFVRRYQRKLVAHKDRQRQAFAPTRREIETKISDFFREQADVFSALSRQASSEELFQEWLEAQHKFEDLLASLEASEDRRPALKAVS